MTPAEQRLEQIAVTHGKLVLAYLARRTACADDAADVYQEVLTTTWRKIHSVPENPDHTLAWLFAVARRALANHRRAGTRRLAATARLAVELAGPADVLSSAVVDHVGEGLAALADDDREIVTLTYWEGLSAEQVAAVVGISPAAARKRLQRARERLLVRITHGARPDAHRSCGMTRCEPRSSRAVGDEGLSRERRADVEQVLLPRGVGDERVGHEPSTLAGETGRCGRPLLVLQRLQQVLGNLVGGALVAASCQVSWRPITANAAASVTAV